MSNQSQLLHYWKLSQLVKSEDAKVAFFDENEEAFYLDPNQGEEIENCKYTFIADQGLTTEESEDFQDNSWGSFPNEFKRFAFKYCIVDGIAYESIESPMSVSEIASLISAEKLNEKLRDEGLTISEAEDDVLLILEKRVKKAGRAATEDDLYDATKKILMDLRDWMDDNHPSNIQAA